MSDVSASDVLAAIAECKSLGRDTFLDRYGFGRANQYFLLHDGERYDSKAIVGVAHKFSHGTPLTPADFSGGENTVVALLRRRGFIVITTRNPSWTRDEVILACDVVARNGWRYLPAEDPQVVELSGLLRRLGVHPENEQGPDFRNPNGVARKTADIATQHPDYRGKPTHGGRHDASVLKDFLRDPETMAALAQAIRDSASGTVALREPDGVDIDNDSADEGGILERKHLARERDPKLRARKIDAVRRSTGLIACEACGFDFAATYGDRGLDYIECHHRVPLHVSGPTKTRLVDLVLVCSNCHRMIHRIKPWLTFEELCALLPKAAS
ncbi:MAG TPA: HNH endonuclease [Actinospica sp.]|jgi:5-methylcytosine-specific restriction protein A|nr:HNH endonuclease [Actinospica sp.]